MNWLTASRLAAWLPHKNWSGTSDLNRDSLGPKPSGLIRFPSPRMSKIWSERLESNQRPRASETRALIQLSYAHKCWNMRPESNRHFFVTTEVFSPLNDARVKNLAAGDGFEPPISTFRKLRPTTRRPGFCTTHWMGGADSNCRIRLQKPASYRWTTSQQIGVTGGN
jgi:hypothetical protein